MTSTTLCHCGEPLYQTDDGLMCKKGHQEQLGGMTQRIVDEARQREPVLDKLARDVISGAVTSMEQVFQQATEKPLAEGGSTALPGSVPVGVTPMTIAGPVNLPLPVGAFRTSDHRYYWNGKGPFPSVTTVLNDVLAKHALIAWKSQQVARAILRDQAAFNRMQWESGDDAAVKWALAEADKQRDDAARIGSSVHLLADLQARQTEPVEWCKDCRSPGPHPDPRYHHSFCQYRREGSECSCAEGRSGWDICEHALGAAESDSKAFQVSEQEKPYLDAFRAFQSFLEARGGRIVSSEHMVWSEVGYAGTYDLILEMPIRSSGVFQQMGATELWLVDIKTSKGIYPDYALQLAAYGHAEQIILEGSPVGFPMPHIDRYAVLHLRPDAYPDTGYRLWEYPITDEDYYRFVSTLDLYLWRKEDTFNKKNLVPVT